MRKKRRNHQLYCVYTSRVRWPRWPIIFESPKGIVSASVNRPDLEIYAGVSTGSSLIGRNRSPNTLSGSNIRLVRWSNDVLQPFLASFRAEWLHDATRLGISKPPE